MGRKEGIKAFWTDEKILKKHERARQNKRLIGILGSDKAGVLTRWDSEIYQCWNKKSCLKKRVSEWFPPEIAARINGKKTSFCVDQGTGDFVREIADQIGMGLNYTGELLLGLMCQILKSSYENKQVFTEKDFREEFLARKRLDEMLTEYAKNMVADLEYRVKLELGEVNNDSKVTPNPNKLEDKPGDDGECFFQRPTSKP